MTFADELGRAYDRMTDIEDADARLKRAAGWIEIARGRHNSFCIEVVEVKGPDGTVRRLPAESWDKAVKL